MKTLEKYFEGLFVLSLVLLFTATVIFNFRYVGDQHFSYLAHSFLQGRVYFVDKLYSWADTAVFDGRYFWPLGPLPAVMILPFVFSFNRFGLFFSQGYLQFFVIVAIYVLVYKIAGKIGYSKKDSHFFAGVFVFGSVFLGVAWWPASWFFSQVISVFLMMLALFFFLNYKSFFWIGLSCGLILLTRPTASLVIVFFILILLKDRISFREKFNKTLILTAPFLVCLMIFVFYNFLRFGNPFETGYGMQILNGFAAERRSVGTFSLKHLPANIYYSLFALPEPVFNTKTVPDLKYPYIKSNPWGMSLFVTSPYLLYLFFLKNKYKYWRQILYTVLLIAVPIFLYYGIGAVQYGYRYSLDFLPLLFFLLMNNYYLFYKKLTPQFKFLLLFSILINLYLFPFYNIKIEFNPHLLSLLTGRVW